MQEVKERASPKACETAGRLVEKARKGFAASVKKYKKEGLKRIFSSPSPRKVVLAPPLLVGGEAWRLTKGTRLGEVVVISTGKNGELGVPMREALWHACNTYGSLEAVEVLGPGKAMGNILQMAGLYAEEYGLELRHTDWGEYPSMGGIEGVVVADADPRVYAGRIFRGEKVVVVHSPGCILSGDVQGILEELVGAGVPAMMLLVSTRSETIENAVYGNGRGLLKASSEWVLEACPTVINGRGVRSSSGASEDVYAWTLVRALTCKLNGEAQPAISGALGWLGELISENKTKVVPVSLDLGRMTLRDI